MKRVATAQLQKPNTYTILLPKRQFSSQTPLWHAPVPRALKRGAPQKIPSTRQSQPKQIPSSNNELASGLTPNIVTHSYAEKPTFPDIRLSRNDSHQAHSLPDGNLDSTRPAPLNTPPALRKEDHNGSIPVSVRAKWLFNLGKSYLGFYRTGMKNIWSNFKERREITSKLAAYLEQLQSELRDKPKPSRMGIEEAIKYGGMTLHGPTADKELMPITRRDYQLYLRLRHDLGKLVPFALIFLICGEFTPLVIILFGSRVVPYTCRIPQQEQHDFLRPAKISQRVADEKAKLLPRAAQIPGGYLPTARSTEPMWQQEFIEAYRLKCNAFLQPLPVIGYTWWRTRVSYTLKTRLEEVLCDTILIQREGGFARLSPRDIFEWSLKACLETLRVEIEELQKQGKKIDPDSTDLKKKLLPVVEEQARYMLDVDWTKIRPEDHWLAAFRGLTTVTPDDVAVKRRLQPA